MVDAEKQQRGHADVEYHRRSAVDEPVVDQADTLEKYPQEQHREDRCGDVQGLDEECKHAGDLSLGR
ncbi:hypothetical protein D3C75_1008340 [compost metagenome]